MGARMAAGARIFMACPEGTGKGARDWRCRGLPRARAVVSPGGRLTEGKNRPKKICGLGWPQCGPNSVNDHPASNSLSEERVLMMTASAPSVTKPPSNKG